MVSCGALASVFGSFSLNAVFIFPVEPCLGWDGRPFIVQRKLIYTWKWKRASAVGCPGFFDGSALSLLGFRRAFRVVIHLHACGLCLLSPSPLLGPAFLLPLPPPSPVPYASREVYLLYLLAAATLGHPQGSELHGLFVQQTLSPGEGFLGEILFPWKYAFSRVAAVQHVHSLGSRWKDLLKIKPARGQQKSSAGRGACCQD